MNSSGRRRSQRDSAATHADSIPNRSKTSERQTARNNTPQTGTRAPSKLDAVVRHTSHDCRLNLLQKSPQSSQTTRETKKKKNNNNNKELAFVFDWGKFRETWRDGHGGGEWRGEASASRLQQNGSRSASDKPFQLEHKATVVPRLCSPYDRPQRTLQEPSEPIQCLARVT